MNALSNILLLAGSLLLSACAGSSISSRSVTLSYEPTGRAISGTRVIDSIIDDSLLSQAFIGVKIVTADSGEILYERNSRKLFHPASNMKLLTTGAAVRLLGTSYAFTTSLQTDSSITDSSLDGNLVVRGSGDPLVTTASLDSLAGQLAQRGIRSIRGDLIGDVSAFDTLGWGTGWMWDDEPSTDAAFISPLSINGNSIDVVVTPGKKNGARAEIRIEPPSDIVTIVDQSTTSADTTIPELEVDRQKSANVVIVRGRIDPFGGERRYSFSVRNPEWYFLSLLRSALLRHGLSLIGNLRLDTCHATMMLASIVNPIDSILHRINKPSDNLAAENLLKTLGKETYGAPGSSKNGIEAVKRYLSGAGVDTTALFLADGSGLSWYNAISPDALVALLLEQCRHPGTFKNFYESLPIAGVDGTLKNRMRGSAAHGNAHAKTGSLTGVSALSGYITGRDGRMMIFSILCNHFPSEIAALRATQNKILDVLANSRIVWHK